MIYLTLKIKEVLVLVTEAEETLQKAQFLVLLQINIIRMTPIKIVLDNKEDIQ